MNVLAYYGTRRGGSGVRCVKDAAEAEKILRGAYQVTTVRLIADNGDIVGVRERHDDLGRGKWFWSFDQDYFTA